MPNALSQAGQLFRNRLGSRRGSSSQSDERGAVGGRSPVRSGTGNAGAPRSPPPPYSPPRDNNQYNAQVRNASWTIGMSHDGSDDILPGRAVGLCVPRPNHNWTTDDVQNWHGRSFSICGPSVPAGVLVHGTEELGRFIKHATNLYKRWSVHPRRNRQLDKVESAYAWIGTAFFGEPVKDIWFLHGVISQAEIRGLELRGLPVSSQILLDHPWMSENIQLYA